MTMQPPHVSAAPPSFIVNNAVLYSLQQISRFPKERNQNRVKWVIESEESASENWVTFAASRKRAMWL